MMERNGTPNSAMLASDSAEVTEKTTSAIPLERYRRSEPCDIHRIGGANIDNLRLKPGETKLNPPGVSVLQADTPTEAAAQIRAAYPDAIGLYEAARTVGSSSIQAIRSVDSDVVPNPTRRLPRHHRLIHLEGADGFADPNLERLAQVFTNTSGN
jgi:hypothetical protein